MHGSSGVMERRRHASKEGTVGVSRPAGLDAGHLTLMRFSPVARPPDHRLPDETLHEVPSDRHRTGGRRQGRFQSGHRLSPRAGSKAALAEEDATGASSARSAGRGLVE